MPRNTLVDPTNIPMRDPWRPGTPMPTSAPQGRQGNRPIFDSRSGHGSLGLTNSVNRMATERSRLAPYREKYFKDLAGQGERQASDVRRMANMRAAQGDRERPTSFAAASEAALRRARARAGVINRGDAAVRGQQLKDRLAVTRQHLSRRGSIHNFLQQHENIKAGVNVGVSDANNRAKASSAEMWGNIAGAAAGIGKSYYDKANTLSEIDMGSLPEYRGDYEPSLGGVKL